MRIRLATIDDAPVLARVHVDSWRSAYRGLVPDSYLDALDYDRRTEDFRKWLGGGEAETYVVEQNGEIAGLLTLGAARKSDAEAEPIGEIWGIYVRPEHWRKGLGSALCRHAETRLRDRGCRRVALSVFAQNQRARRFYEAMGFRTDGASRTANFGVPLEVVRYRKELQAAEPPPDRDSVPAAR